MTIKRSNYYNIILHFWVQIPELLHVYRCVKLNTSPNPLGPSRKIMGL